MTTPHDGAKWPQVTLTKPPKAIKRVPKTVPNGSANHCETFNKPHDGSKLILRSPEKLLSGPRNLQDAPKRLQEAPKSLPRGPQQAF